MTGNSAPCGNCRYCQEGQENLCDDLLFLNGAYAESVVIPARMARKNLLRLKPGTAFADAALTEPLACVAQGWEEMKPQRRAAGAGHRQRADWVDVRRAGAARAMRGHRGRTGTRNGWQRRPSWGRPGGGHRRDKAIWRRR